MVLKESLLRASSGGVACQGAIVTPLWTTSGRMLGAFAVGANGLMSLRRSVLTRALGPLEALACKVERAMENAALAERLMLAERHAGLGVLAAGNSSLRLDCKSMPTAALVD